jgi:cyclic pyranopterin phosphate synthase
MENTVESSGSGREGYPFVQKWVDSSDGPKAPLFPGRSPIQSHNEVTEEGHTAEPTAECKPVLSHVDASGKANMVDVSAKPATERSATARAVVRFKNARTYPLVLQNSNSKGDVFGVARIAGIMAAKRTAELIPLCHPVSITNIDLDIKPIPPPTSGWRLRRQSPKMDIYGGVEIEATVRCFGPTGVEMEALTAANVAALTVYDMCKAVDKGMRLSAKLIEKSGGRSGTWTTDNP